MCVETPAPDGYVAKPAASHNQMVDNDRVRVTEWVFAPDGAKTRVQMTAGVSYFRQKGVAHDVINAGDGELRFVETELK